MAHVSRHAASLAVVIRQAEACGFGAMALRGMDVRAAIGSATDRRDLEAGIRVAEQTGEPFWAEQLIRRLCEVDPSNEPRLRLALFAAFHGELEDAKAVLCRTTQSKSPRASEDALCNIIDGILLANEGKADEAMLKFNGVGPRGSGQRLPRTAVLAAQSMIERCNLNAADNLIQRLSETYPSSLIVRSLKVRCRLLLGAFDEARRLTEFERSVLDRSSLPSRRAFVEAVAEVLEAFGWHSHLLDYLYERIKDDPAHWNLYGRAAGAARATSRDKQYAELVENIPASWCDTAEGLAIRCNWLVDENRMNEASDIVEKIRSLSAGWYLGVRLYHDLHTTDRPELDEAIEPYQRCGVSSLSAIIAFAFYTYYLNSSRRGLERCVMKLREFEFSAPTNANFWLIYLKCLIAVGENNKAIKLYRALPPGLAKCAPLQPFQMWIDASRGHHHEARKAWQEYIRVTRHRAVNAPSSYPKTGRLKYDERPGTILLFSTVFNGQSYLDWFLGHYRAIGVDHFFIIDNGSTDGSLDRLCAEPDVSVFSNPHSFASSAFGALWINHLMQRFGVGHWCFHVDLDEGFVFPGCDSGGTLRELLQYCDDQGFGAIAAIQLDMYPERLDGRHSKDPFSECCYFDTDYEFIPCELPPYVFIQGGLRRRLTKVGMLMHKTPLVRVSSDMRYLECNHGTTHLPVADVTGALLHYKFIVGMKERIDEAVQRREHFGAAIFYRRLDDAVSTMGWTGSLLSKFSRRYDGSRFLVQLGLLTSSPRWEAYLQHRVN
jgi:tetratricopeptide (TPR) repeat protein